ncbi:MAG: hypothetical protein K8S14_09820 [Actinomycetia bacterium]|nr:hypothetical protein [Actinomycetes bacterium]
MSIESQKIIEIIQYIGFAGLIIPGIAVFFISDLRKKITLLFIMFVFITILSFVFYSGVLLFIASLAFIFVFVLLFLLTEKLFLQDSGNPLPPSDTGEKHATGTIAIKITNIMIPVLFCAGLGYLIRRLMAGYFPADNRAREISITNMEELSGIIFTEYSIIIFLII